MADAADAPEPSKKKFSGPLPLILGAVAALVLGVGAAYAVKTGLVPTPEVGSSSSTYAPEVEKVSVTYLELPPIAVPLTPRDGRPRQLRLALSVETPADQLQDVEAQTPRLLDALNTLLRAIDEDDIANPTALDRLRAQMLRRLRLATHPEAVRDLLIVEYVIL